MYVPPIFAARDADGLHDFIEAHSFATVVATGPDGLIASHLPVLLDRDRGPHGTLTVHLARPNPQGRTMDGQEVLVIFTGPHGYISPSWYETHPSVPTWNYAAVHAYGRARAVTDPAQLKDIVRRLTEQYESGRDTPWTMAGLPQDYVAGMLRGIVGFAIEITRLEGKHKLSQNRNATDRRNVIAALGASADPDDRALAEYMARHAPPQSAK